MTRGPNIYVAVVDDDEGVRRSMVRLLTAAHFRPVAYASAEEFLADRKRPDFDCVVLDIWLEGMGGIELQRRLKASPGAPPVVFITARDEAQVREEALALGCAGYFRKVDAGDAILATIERAATEHHRQSGES